MQIREALGRAATLPPGPELSSALASVSLALVPNDLIVDVLQAQARQSAHEQARLLAAIVEVGRATPGAPDGDVRRSRYLGASAAGEVAAALTLTARSADRELDFADTVVQRLPQVFAALLSGRLDRAKAWVFADQLHPAACGLSDVQIEALCLQLVPPAHGWTTGQLAARLLRAIVAIDPEHARRRYEKALRGRAVSSYLDRDGTVTIAATGLAPDQAASACERLKWLAARVKRAGHPGRLAEIEADLFLGLLDGRYLQHTEDDIVVDQLSRAGVTGEQPAAAADGAPSDAQRTSPAPPPHDQRTSPGRGRQDPHRAGEAANRPAGKPDPTGSLKAGIEIRVGLATLLGLDQRPGEIPGLGPVLPDVARAAVTAQSHGGSWRFAVTDPDGHLLLAGPILRRPKLPDARRSRGGVVEIHVAAVLLDQLPANTAACGPWSAIVAEIAQRYARADVITSAIDRHPALRFASAALARHVQVRDRTCTHPGCRRPARKSDLDHTRGYASGGPTTSENIGPGCGRHHFYKSELGWRLRQPEPGNFEWTSPLGRVYRTRGDPIDPP